MSSPVVQISDGKVKGRNLTDSNGENFHAFLSIPFGKAPVGDLRFKAPRPVDPWEGVKDATKQGDCNIQFNFMKGNILEGSEDSLNLHVFTKKLPSEERRLKPVLLFIHGGGFAMGSHDVSFFGPGYLITEDVVVVSTTYRQGILGYLSLEDSSLDVPGNAGLKDLVLALKWIHRNIQDFNGDPNNVTIFGESAGGAAVEYLVLSPSAKNLFHKAIAMSGSTLNPWTRNKFDPVDFCKSLGYPDLTEKEVLKVLTEMTAEDLYRAQYKYQLENYYLSFGLIAPVVEKPNPTAFITKRAIDIMQAGEQNQVPYITGFCDQEGLVFLLMNKMAEMIGKAYKEDPTMKYLVPNDVTDEKTVKKMVDKIKEFYSKDQYKDTFDMSSDSQFTIGCLISALNMSKTSKYKVYSYRFAFNGEFNFIKKMTGLDYKGASHGDDLGYLFKPDMAENVEVGEAEKLTIKRLVKMWTNFAKYGNPTPKGNDLEIEWKPIQNKHFNFLHIGEELVPSEDPYPDRLEFWKEVFQMDPVTAKYLKNIY